MAVTLTSLDAGSATGPSGQTASISPGTDRLILLAVTLARDASPGPEDSLTVTGCGLTWVQAATSFVWRVRRRTWLFRAMGSPTPGAVSIGYTGVGAIQDMTWSVVEASGVDTSGSDGSGAVGEVQTNFSPTGTTGGNVTVTLTGGLGAEDVTYSAGGLENNDATLAPSAGWDSLDVATSDNVRRQVTAWSGGGEGSVTWDWSGGSSGYGFLLVQIVGAAGGGDVTVTAAATVDVAGVKVAAGDPQVAAAAQVAAAGVKRAVGDLIVAAAGQVTAAGVKITAGAVVVSAVATVDVAGEPAAGGDVLVAAAGLVAVTGTKVAQGSAAVTARALLVVTGQGPDVRDLTLHAVLLGSPWEAHMVQPWEALLTPGWAGVLTVTPLRVRLVSGWTGVLEE